ncbi:MAG: hypothetical protein OXC28_26880 [Defluviicoccus sp.]|nr:hypothetical protein [Defluviicoccus sp.]
MPTADLLTILGSMLAIGVALAGLILATQRSMRAEIGELRREVREDIQNLHNEISSLRERMAKLEGLLEGLREAITARQPAA